MRLAQFGMIRIDGKATRPEPGASFDDYQRLLFQNHVTRTVCRRVDATQKQAARAPYQPSHQATSRTFVRLVGEPAPISQAARIASART
mgnify:CR=1 FL=1